MPYLGLNFMYYKDMGDRGTSGPLLHFLFIYFFMKKEKKNNILTKITKHSLEPSCYVQIFLHLYFHWMISKINKLCALTKWSTVPHLRGTEDQILLFTLM